jgi:phosphate/sulfate permease
VGAKSLTLRSACMIALVTEFVGAITLGADVADTIKGKIISQNDFKGQSDMLMLGMFCSSIGSSVWVNGASYIGMPVSTTHATVGSTIGVGIAFGGKDSVLWGECTGSSVNDCNGVVKIVTSWFISPALSAAFAGFVFLITKHGILAAGGEESYKRARMAMPLYIGGVWTIVTFFMALKGGPALNSAFDLYTKDAAGVQTINGSAIGPLLGVAFGVGAFFAIVSVFAFLLNPKFEAYCMKTAEEEEKEARAAKEKTTAEEDPSSIKNVLMKMLFVGMDREVTEITDGAMGAEYARKAHDIAEAYYEPTERTFQFVQIFTASFASLSHGANDVANAIGPFCTVYHVWKTGFPELSDSKKSKKVPVPAWILAFGGIFIDLGLAFDGWRIMQNLGNNITYHSPSRGLCMELGALTTVLLASQQGIPVSTTHCITGATVGVGMCNGDMASINWLMVAWASFGWVVTLPCAGLVAGLIFAFIGKAPKLLSMTDQTAILTFTEDALKNLSVPDEHKMRGMCFVQSSCNLVRFIKAFDEPVFDMQRKYTFPSEGKFIKNDRYSWANNLTKVYK